MSDPVVALLQRRVLAWDYWLLYTSYGDEGRATEALRRPALTFATSEEYIAAFRPLLLAECAALLLQRTDFDKPPHAQQGIAAAATEDDGFMDVSFTLAERAPKDFRDNDCVLVSSVQPTVERSGNAVHCLGWVRFKEGSGGMTVRLHLGAAVSHSEASSARIASMRARLSTADSCWWLLTLASLSTISREWTALHRVARTPTLRSVLTAQDSTVTGLGSKRKMAPPPALASVLEGAFNSSQRSAVSAGLNAGSRLVLVQGPPGTGKTKTILGLLSVLSAAIPADSPALLRASGKPVDSNSGSGARTPSEMMDLRRRASPWIGPSYSCRARMKGAPLLSPSTSTEAKPMNPLFGLEATATVMVLSSAQKRRPHVLVCAPSNGALDEVAMRLVRNGLLDARGRPWKPAVVRVGMSVHHSLEAISLDSQVRAKMDAAEQPVEGRQERAERERLQAEILDGADVICCTLSFAGSGVLSRMARPLDALVVDEAAQTVEPACLIPMTLGMSQVYLVGDPNQLPATVISDAARANGYDVSLFQRLQSSGHPVQMLDTQYRMHPTICSFISRQFYKGRVKDAPGLSQLTTQPWHHAPCFGPFAFFDVRGKEVQEGTSIVNRVEAEMVMCLYKELTTEAPSLRTRPAIAVISPYKSQVSLLREKFKLALGNDYQHLDIDTIDGFQGREKDVCIFTTVRSRQQGGIGFVADSRRINVGLSRARCSLLVVGNSASLRKDKRWAGVVSYADSIGCLFRASKPFLPYLAGLAGGEGRDPADVVADHQSNHFSTEAEGGTYDDEDAYSDYDEMPATLEAAPKDTAAPVAHSSLNFGQGEATAVSAAGKSTGRTRGGAKRKAT